MSARTPDPAIDRLLDFPGRGPLRVRDIPGPCDDAPGVLLLHGLGATARLNWAARRAGVLRESPLADGGERR